MNKEYFSFLICSHKTGIDQIYINGLEIGKIQDGVFTPDKLYKERLSVLKNHLGLKTFLGDINHNICKYLDWEIIKEQSDKALHY